MSARPPLPAPRTRLAEHWIWQLQAQCRKYDSAIFFHPEGERGLARRRRQQRAKAVCAQCPVIGECREHSVIYQEAFGTWGGLTEEERARLLRPHAVNLRTHHGVRKEASVAAAASGGSYETGGSRPVTATDPLQG